MYHAMYAYLNSVSQGDLPLVSLLTFLHYLSFKFIQYAENAADLLSIPLPSAHSNFLIPIISHPLSYAVFCINLCLTLTGTVYLISFYRRTVRVVFNSNLPPLFTDSSFSSFYSYFLLTRPISIIFRFLTYNLRVKPDLLIIGEVRCGTTSMSQHVTMMEGCRKPFCPWKHPELDGKETFYFSGHYTTTSPKYYRMCFPLKLTRFFHTKILRRPFFTFDGCAQYLTSPTTPVLMADVFRGEEPPVVISMVRDPVEQAVSWWKYERAAMGWGRSMGLTSRNVKLRTKEYWSKTIGEALKFR